MKWIWMAVAIGLPLVTLLLVESVDATANCSLPVADRCKGFSMVGTTTGGVSSGRCFNLHTVNSAPACSTTGIGTTANEAWELNAGGCITLYYYDVANGAVPPAVPNKVTIAVYVDSVGVVKTFLAAGTEPANGSNYSFCATSDGNTGSSPRAGTYYLDLIVLKDNGPGGVGNYNIRTNGVGTQDTSFDGGGVRAKTFVASIARNAYPAGSMFAYGPAGDETMTITSTFTQPNGDANVETVFNSILDESTLLVGQVGATVDIDAVTTLAQNFIADNTYPFANNPYVPGFTIAGNSVLFDMKWTVLASTGHGTNLVRVSDTFIYDSTDITIDTRIAMDSDGAGTFATADNTLLAKVGSSSGTVATKFNRGETVYEEEYIFNGRNELLSRSMTFAREDAALTVCGTQSRTPTSNKYSGTGALSTGGACLAAATDPGSPHYTRITNTDQTYLSGIIFYDSSLYYEDAHIENDATLTKDDYPTENANEVTAYIISTAQTDTTRGWCHVKGVRKDVEIDTSGSTVGWAYVDPTSTQRLGGSTDTASDGWTPTHLDLLASTPLGNWHFNCNVAFSGNTGSDSQLFTVTVPAGGGGDTFVGDPLKIFAAPVIANANESVLFTISEAYLNGTGRIGNAAGTFIYIYDPSNTPIVNGVNVTEIQFGIYNYVYGLGATPTTGNWYAIARTTDPTTGLNISSSNAFRVEPDGSVSIGSVTGQMLKIFAAPVIANPSESVLFTISESALNGTSRTGNAAGTLLYIYDPSGAIVVNGAAATEVQFGIYSYTYSLGASPASGNWFAIAKVLDPTTNGTVATANNFRVESDGDLIPLTSFETLTGVNAFEFMVLLGIVLLAILIWSRSTDFLIQFVMGILAFIPAVIWMVLFAQNGWKGDLALAIFSAMVGVYLLVRAGIDRFTSGDTT